MSERSNNIYDMLPDLYHQLSRLERRIMDAVYRLGGARVADVVRELNAADASESIRVTMANLEKKAVLTHHREGMRNVYTPTVSEGEARTSVMDNLLRTFFDDSPASAILSLLDRRDMGLSDKEVDEIASKIRALEADEEAD